MLPGQHDGSALPDWSRRDALVALQNGFDVAAAASGTRERWFAIGGRSVHVRFAGEAPIAAFVPSLAHLAALPSDAVDLSVDVWDSRSTGVDVPQRPPRAEGTDDGVLSSYHIEPRILTLYDSHARHGVVWVPDGKAVPSNEVASPLRTLLHWWARDIGIQFVHAGAVGRNGRAVLLAGPSGAGKSTTALASLLSGLDYLGDDYVLVEPSVGATIHSLYSAAKLQPEQVAAFPELRPTLTNAERLATEKALWFVHSDFPERTRAAATAVAVLVPRVTGETGSRVSPISRATALTALAPSTIVQLSGADHRSLAMIAAFLQRVPAYRLDAGTDLRGVAAVVASVVDGAEA